MQFGSIKGVPLEFKEGSWKFDPELFRKSITDKTKLFLLNNPHNPTGKNFTRDELQ
jgi:aspartate/methionine/tyrosine aminotransferase